MSVDVLTSSLAIAQVLLTAAMGFSAYRILAGPRAQDRVLGFDTLYVNGMLLLLTIGIGTGTSVYFEAALIIAVFGFVGTVALSKFLLRGEIIE